MWPLISLFNFFFFSQLFIFKPGFLNIFLCFYLASSLSSWSEIVLKQFELVRLPLSSFGSLCSLEGVFSVRAVFKFLLALVFCWVLLSPLCLTSGSVYWRCVSGLPLPTLCSAYTDLISAGYLLSSNCLTSQTYLLNSWLACQSVDWLPEEQHYF